MKLQDLYTGASPCITEVKDGGPVFATIIELGNWVYLRMKRRRQRLMIQLLGSLCGRCMEKGEFSYCGRREEEGRTIKTRSVDEWKEEHFTYLHECVF